MSSPTHTGRHALRLEGDPVRLAASAVRHGDLLFVGGQVALDEHGEVTARGDVAGQARIALDRVRRLVEQAGGTLDDVVDVLAFHADPRDMEAVLGVVGEIFPHRPPAYTPVGFVGCEHPGALVMIRAVAHLGDGDKACFVPDSQAWVRRHGVSAACRKGDLIFVAGQSGADREGRFERPLDHCAQARAAYDLMLEVLAEAGGGVGDVLDFTSFHLDIRGAIPTLEEIYMPQIMGPIDTDEAATTSHVGSTGLLTPDTLGVYSALADVSPGRRVGSTPDAIWWKGKYPIAGAAKKEQGSVVTVAGQVSSAPDGSILHAGDTEAQVRFVLEEMREALAGFGLAMSSVAEVSSFHKDPRCHDTVMRVAAEFFDAEAPPAWTFAGVPGLWFEGYIHEIGAYAVVA